MRSHEHGSRVPDLFLIIFVHGHSDDMMFPPLRELISTARATPTIAVDGEYPVVSRPALAAAVHTPGTAAFTHRPRRRRWRSEGKRPYSTRDELAPGAFPASASACLLDLCSGHVCVLNCPRDPYMLLYRYKGQPGHFNRPSEVRDVLMSTSVLARTRPSCLHRSYLRSDTLVYCRGWFDREAALVLSW